MRCLYARFDRQMLVYQNGKERTLASFVDLYAKAGWKITRVQYNDPVALTLPTLIAVPA